MGLVDRELCSLMGQKYLESVSSKVKHRFINKLLTIKCIIQTFFE